MSTSRCVARRKVLLSLVLLIGALVIPVLPDSLILEDCPSGQLLWKTYKSTAMQMSFSYPATWQIFSERATGLGVEVNLKAKTFFVNIERLNDKTESEKTQEKLFYGLKKHDNSSEEKIVIGKDTCTEIRFMAGVEERVTIHWPQKRIVISFTYTAPKQMQVCSSIISQTLSSFEFTGDAAIPVKNKNLSDYANSSFEWKAYSSPELLVSFSYPSFWNISPEHSEYGGLALRLNSTEDSSTIGLVIRRWTDTTGSGNSYHNFFAEANQQKPGEGNYNKKNVSFSDNTCTEVSYTKSYIRRNVDETTTSIYCPQKKLIITFFYSSKAELVYGSIVKRVLSSFTVDDGRAK